jgi:5-methylcytosine-specific restriction endonuclease McrA
MTEVKICKKCGGIKEGEGKKRCKPCGKKRRKENLSKPGVKERIKEYMKPYLKLYRANPDVKEREKEYREKHRANPDVKEREKEYRKKHQSKPEVKQRNKEWYKEYIKRPGVKEIIKSRGEKRREKIRASPEIKEQYKKYRETPEVKERYKDKQKEYREAPEVKERYKQYDKCWKRLFGGNNASRAEKRGNYADRDFSRIDIFKRDKFTCQYCKKKLKLDECQEEHIIPVSKGGAHVWENLTTSCQPCNQAKAAKLLNGVQITIFDKVKE